VLAPDARLTLLDALRPPAGYQLGCAVGTTFSLNLDAALTAPAAFALHTVTDAMEPRDVEPLELLDSIRRHAGRYTIFFQAGQIPVPTQRRLFAYLEGALVPVTAPGGGVFHPKVWVLRFDAAVGPSSFRMLCASRNLTIDRSWDTILRLDSVDTDEAEQRFDGSGLARFVRALPSLAVGPIADDRRANIAELADALDEVTWALPPLVDSGRCVPIGLDRQASPPFPARADRVTVISPFLTNGLLKQLPACDGRRVLVSRPDQLDACAATVRTAFDEFYTLDPDATPVTRGTPAPDGTEPQTEASQGVMSTDDPSVSLEGLHAKVFVFDDAATATVLTGSANATTAAFAANVEFVCELKGPRRMFGVDALLAEPAKEIQTLRSFLMPYVIADEAGGEGDELADDPLDRLRQAIAAVPVTARAIETEGGAFDLRFTTAEPLPAFDGATEWRCWPVTLNDAGAVGCRGGEPLDVCFRVSFEGITAFMANELRLGEAVTRFVLTAQLVEAPVNRDTRLLRLLLGDAERLLRYLLMLLSDDAREPASLADLLDALEGDGGRWQHTAASLPLLEALLRTLAHDPGRLDQVQRLIEDLRADVEGDALLPAGLDAIWEPIWAAAEEMRR
jgi:hypothetical protein